MAKMSDEDTVRKEKIESLKGKRLELVESVRGLEFEASKVEIYELHEKIRQIDDQIHAIDPASV